MKRISSFIRRRKQAKKTTRAAQSMSTTTTSKSPSKFQQLQSIGKGNNTQPASALLENNESTQNALAHEDAEPLRMLMKTLNDRTKTRDEQADAIAHFVTARKLDLSVRPQFHPVKRENDEERMIALQIPEKYVKDVKKQYIVTTKTIAGEKLHYVYLDDNRKKIFFDKKGLPFLDENKKPIAPEIKTTNDRITWRSMDEGKVNFTQLNAIIEKSPLLKEKSTYVLEVHRSKTIQKDGKSSSVVDSGAYLKFHLTQREINLGRGKIGVNDMHFPKHTVWTLSLYYKKEVVKCTFNQEMQEAYYVPANPSPYGNCKQNLSVEQSERLVGEMSSLVSGEKDKVGAVKKALFRWAHQLDPKERDLPAINDLRSQKKLVTPRKGVESKKSARR